MAVLNNFDHNNSKYKICGVHVTTASKIVTVILAIGTLINVIYSLTRTSTVIFYSFVVAAFAVGIYGTLIYAVFKEKRPFLLPFLAFQAVYCVIDALVLLAVILITAFSRDALLELARDMTDLNVSNDDDNVAHVRGIFVIFILCIAVYSAVQALILYIIFNFYKFLRDRETSFSFTMEPEFRME